MHDVEDRVDDEVHIRFHSSGRFDFCAMGVPFIDGLCESVGGSVKVAPEVC